MWNDTGLQMMINRAPKYPEEVPESAQSTVRIVSGFCWHHEGDGCPGSLAKVDYDKCPGIASLSVLDCKQHRSNHTALFIANT